MLFAQGTPPPPSTISSWLIAVAVLGALVLVAYAVPLFRGQTRFDLNKIVPMLLECGGVVAAVKMMVLAFRIGTIIKGNPVEDVFDAGSILIGGAVFFCASLYALVNNILSAYTGPTDDGNAAGG